MNTQTARTAAMTSRTTQLTGRVGPSRQALATRSLIRARQLKGEARAEAMRAHFATFVTRL